MKRLIDAEELKHRVNNSKYYGTERQRDFCDMITESETIDAVEVVRCGECKHMLAYGRCMEFADDGIRPSATDFCSYGERREP